MSEQALRVGIVGGGSELDQSPDELIECPAQMVEQATEETWEEIHDRLIEMLGDELMPEPMREDTQARLARLLHRFADGY